MSRLCSSLLLSLLIASSASAVTVSWSAVGDLGNPCRIQSGCAGSVNYVYNIGTYEITNNQYAEFLNAKALSDPLALYSTNMGDTNYGGISRTGSNGSYIYSPIVGRENMPVTYVSYYDALRFANWINNGQGSADTESGAYSLLGGTTIPSNGSTVLRNGGATIVLASRDEWFKAAYYDAASTSYFLYPTRTSVQSYCTYPTAATNTANCAGNHVGITGPVQPTAVGSYSGSPGPYGTYDQGGNAGEWTEGVVYSSSRPMIGGSFYDPGAYLSPGYEGTSDGKYEFGNIGFRLAMIPEPGNGLLVIAGLLGLAGWRRGRA
jgi:formylglycine-generating enzyme